MKSKHLIATALFALPLHLMAADPAAPVSPAPDAKPAPAVEAQEAKAAKDAAPDLDKPIATVNGVALPQAFGRFVHNSRVSRGMPPEALTDEAIVDALVSTELLAQEAARKGLDKSPLLNAALEFQKKELLSKAALEDFLRSNPIPEETLKAEYDKAKAKTGDLEYRARHILVDSEKEAKDIIAKLKNKKTKFEQLAAKQSKDTSAGNGGDLGWTLPTNLVPEFSAAMVKLKKGETTQEPVKTQFGWHVVKLEETRKVDFPSYDKVKDRIASQLQQQSIRKYVQELRATAKVN